jgi:hypothetical protein
MGAVSDPGDDVGRGVTGDDVGSAGWTGLVTGEA